MQNLKPIICVLLLLSGCTQKPIINDLREVKPLSSFSSVLSFVGLIPDAPEVTLLEGLPHPTWKAELLKSEYREHSTVNRGGFNFYDTPLVMDNDDVAQLLNLMRSNEGFQKWTGYKLCGGFHPDFTTIWKCEEGDLEIQFCFGCEEAKLFWNGSYILCDLTDTSDPQYKNLLKKYHKHLGKPETK